MALSDKDRIFRNLYGFQPWNLPAAQKRGCWDGTAAILAKGRDWIISRGLKGGERVIVENAAQHAAGSSVQAVVRQPASADAPSPLAASPAGQ